MPKVMVKTKTGRTYDFIEGVCKKEEILHHNKPNPVIEGIFKRLAAKGIEEPMTFTGFKDEDCATSFKGTLINYKTTRNINCKVSSSTLPNGEPIVYLYNLPK